MIWLNMASREKNDDLCIGHRQLFTDYYIKDVIKKKEKAVILEPE